MLEFRVYPLEECLINKPPPKDALAASLLGLLVPKLIEMAIGGVAAAIKRLGDDKTELLTGDKFIDLYTTDEAQKLSINPKFRCLLGVWFEDAPKRAAADDPIAIKLKEAKLIPATAALGGVFEAAVRPTSDGTAFFLDTRHFSVRKFIRRGQSERGYAVAMSLAAPDATTEGSTFALGKIELGERTREGALEPPWEKIDAFGRYRSNLMPYSMISEAAKTAYNQDVAANQAQNRSYMPVTVTMTIAETTKGSAFLQKLGELLAGLAGDAAKEISKRILPGERAETAAEKAADAEKLYEEELNAELEEMKAQRAYDEATDEKDKAELLVALEIAKRRRKWRKSLREAAGLPPRST